jgi:hypothetical protein
MRLLAVPVLALGLLVGSHSDEPGEGDMRAAFQARLTADVATTLDYVAEVGGYEAVQRVRAAGTDRFTIRSFRKRDCTRNSEMPGFMCDFAVDIDVVNGALSHTLSGHFVPGPHGLVFRDDA